MDGIIYEQFYEDKFFFGVCQFTPLYCQMVELKPRVVSTEVSLWVYWTIIFSMVLVILDLHLKLSTSETFSDGQMEDTGFKYFVPAKLKLLIIGTQV